MYCAYGNLLLQIAIFLQVQLTVLIHPGCKNRVSCIFFVWVHSNNVHFENQWNRSWYYSHNKSVCDNWNREEDFPANHCWWCVVKFALFHIENLKINISFVVIVTFAFVFWSWISLTWNLTHIRVSVAHKWHAGFLLQGTKVQLLVGEKKKFLLTLQSILITWVEALGWHRSLNHSGGEVIQK